MNESTTARMAAREPGISVSWFASRSMGAPFRPAPGEVGRRSDAVGEDAPSFTVRRVVESIVRIPKGQGTVAEVLKTLGAAGVGVLAHCSYSDTFATTLLLVVEDDALARQVIDDLGLKSNSESVVVVEMNRRLGLAAQIGAWLTSAQIHIVYSYVNWRRDEGMFAVFKTTDDHQALQVLESKSVPARGSLSERLAGQAVAA